MILQIFTHIEQILKEINRRLKRFRLSFTPFKNRMISFDLYILRAHFRKFTIFFLGCLVIFYYSTDEFIIIFIEGLKVLKVLV